jgi:hypothetical protein
MSEDGKRGVGRRPQATAPILDSTGREHTPLKFKANAVGKNRWTIPEDTLS